MALKFYYMQFAPRLLLPALLGLLSACAGAPANKPALDAESQQLNRAHLQHVAEIQNFSLRGRIGVQTSNKGFSGGLQWLHQPPNDDIALYSPLGGQVASVKRTSELITLLDANGNSISANDAETLTQAALGWQLPLTGLADWSLGRPANRPVESSTWDAQGLLTTLHQDGWRIEYQNYAEQYGYQLPAKIILKSEKVNLKLLVETWLHVESTQSQPDSAGVAH